MPTGTTETRSVWPGGESTMTYNNQGRLASATLFVPNGFTGTISLTQGGVTSQIDYVAPVDGHPEIVPTPNGTVETLNGVLGMRWTRTFQPAVDTEQANTSWAVGCSRTNV